MQVPLQLTIRDVEHTDAIEQKLRQKAEKLNQYSDNIISCHVVVERTQSHKNTGKLYNVRINLTLPGKELFVNHNEQEDLYVSIREAFDDMTRKVEEASRKIKGEVKVHPELIHGEVVRMFDGYGFIVDENGDEYYFNEANVVHPRLKELEVGTPVHFIEAMGDEGPQAHRVSAKEPKS